MDAPAVTPDSDQVVPVVESPDHGNVVHSPSIAAKAENSHCSDTLRELISNSKPSASVGCAIPGPEFDPATHQPGPLSCTLGCSDDLKTLKRACPALVYRRRKQQAVVKEFPAPTTVRLAEQLRYNLSRSLTLDGSSSPEHTLAGRASRFQRIEAVGNADKDASVVAEEPGTPPLLSE